MMGFDTNSKSNNYENFLTDRNKFFFFSAALFFSGVGTIIFYIVTGGKGKFNSHFLIIYFTNTITCNSSFLCWLFVWFYWCRCICYWFQLCS